MPKSCIMYKMDMMTFRYWLWTGVTPFIFNDPRSRILSWCASDPKFQGSIGIPPIRYSSHWIPPTEFLPHGIPPTRDCSHSIPPTRDSSHTGFLPHGIPPTRDSSHTGSLPHRIPPTRDCSHGIAPKQDCSHGISPKILWFYMKDYMTLCPLRVTGI